MISDWYVCRECGDEYSAERHALGYRICLWCGEQHAREARESWCVIQEYGKGGYMFVTADSAPITLKQTNQKEIRT